MSPPPSTTTRPVLHRPLQVVLRAAPRPDDGPDADLASTSSQAPSMRASGGEGRVQSRSTWGGPPRTRSSPTAIFITEDGWSGGPAAISRKREGPLVVASGFVGLKRLALQAMPSYFISARMTGLKRRERSPVAFTSPSELERGGPLPRASQIGDRLSRLLGGLSAHVDATLQLELVP